MAYITVIPILSPMVSIFLTLSISFYPRSLLLLNLFISTSISFSEVLAPLFIHLYLSGSLWLVVNPPVCLFLLIRMVLQRAVLSSFILIGGLFILSHSLLHYIKPAILLPFLCLHTFCHLFYYYCWHLYPLLIYILLIHCITMLLIQFSVFPSNGAHVLKIYFLLLYNNDIGFRIK